MMRSSRDPGGSCLRESWAGRAIDFPMTYPKIPLDNLTQGHSNSKSSTVLEKIVETVRNEQCVGMMFDSTIEMLKIEVCFRAGGKCAHTCEDASKAD